MAKLLGSEQVVHGPSWGHVHGGYFADSTIAKPLIEAVREIWAQTQPQVIVDLGGGTGFLLSQLREAGLGTDSTFVNLDASVEQLSEAEKAGLPCIHGAVDTFRRHEVVLAERKALFVMRSVLHYAGEAGLAPLLRHLRAQAAAGEFWVHQTACFDRKEDADCLNALYRRMHTGKWYPTVDELQKQLMAAGWSVSVVRSAPMLHLDSDDLGLRYGLDEAEMQRIGKEMASEFGAQNEVFHVRANEFRADLHYHIFVCMGS